MRLLAFTLFGWAAADWPLLGLDRAGVALAGLACMALALPRPIPRKAHAPVPVPFGLEAAGDYPLAEEASGVVERILAAAGVPRGAA